MPTADLTITPSEASALFEEKVKRLRAEMAQAQRGSQDAVSQRDHALAEVTTLQQEKAQLIAEIDASKQETTRIKGLLAEHRANVEASLNAQEAKANVVIEEARATAEAVKEAARVNQQVREQLKGV